MIYDEPPARPAVAAPDATEHPAGGPGRREAQQPSRVEINAGGRHIIVVHQGELEQLTTAAMGMWERAVAPAVSLGPGQAGFQMERNRGQAPEPSSMRRPIAQPR